MKKPILTTILALPLAVATSASAATLIDNNFDGVANDTGPAFQQVYNGQGTVNTDLTTGLIQITTTGNAAVGFNSSATVDASSATSFTFEWVVDSASAATTTEVTSNGWFFGLTNNNSSAGSGLYNNSGEHLGFRMRDWVLLANGEATTALGGSTPSEASIADGFSLSLTLNDDDSYSASSTGLSNNFNLTGSFSSGYYASIASSLSLNTSIQGTVSSNDLNYTVASATLTTVPEPSAALLVGLAGLGLLLRRRR